MAQNWYQCTKCGSTVKNDTFPSAAGCSKGTTHHWHKLAEVGSSNYTCGKCETTIQAKSFPDSAGCLSGGSHNWHKL